MNDMNRAEEVTATLREAIQAGQYASGTKMPSERDLAKQYDISRETLRRAMQVLEGEGFITKRGTAGTYVRAETPRIEVIKGEEWEYEDENNGGRKTEGDELARVGSFIANMKRKGRQPKVTFIDPPALVAASEDVAYHLRVDPKALVLRRYRLQSADNVPYRIIESYYPSDLFGELLQIDIGDKPLFQWLKERHNKQVQHVAEELTARLPTPSERQHLRISSSSPVVSFDRTVWDQDKRVIEWAHVTAVAALYRFHYEYDINWEKEPIK